MAQPGHTEPAGKDLPPHLLLFDGECNLCNALVQFILRHDHQQRFRFAALQSATGQRVARELPAQERAADSLIYLRNGRLHTRSTAALLVARDLSGVWPLAYGLIVLPRFLRNAGYDLVARHRYRWFGKRDQCMVPTAELVDRFLP